MTLISKKASRSKAEGSDAETSCNMETAQNNCLTDLYTVGCSLDSMFF